MNEALTLTKQNARVAILVSHAEQEEKLDKLKQKVLGLFHAFF